MSYELVDVFELGEWILRRGIVTSSRQPILAVTTNNGENARLLRSWELRNELDPESTLAPLAYDLIEGRYHLILPDPGSVLAELPLPLEIETALRIGIAVAEALERFHARNFVHRDVRPSTISYDDKRGRAWLGGTGLSLRLSRGAKHNDSVETMVGTPAYMAPEQTGRVNWPVDTRSDLYALGAVLYQLLTGRVPFEDKETLSLVHAHIARPPEPPDTGRPEIPSAVSSLVLRLLAKDPRDRYQTAGGVARDLRHCLESWNSTATIPSFPLGVRDQMAEVRIPDRIVGRAQEVAKFDRMLTHVVETASPALLIVSGDSGVGKSSLVEDALRRQNANHPEMSIATGKIDALGRGAPLAALGRALASIAPELRANEPLAASVREAVAPHGRLLAGISPDLADLFQADPVPSELAAREAHVRFQRVVQAFVRTIARPRKPFVLFLDDIQWINEATVEVVRSLLSDPEMGPLLVVVAHRTQEVDPALVVELKQAARFADEIRVEPLGHAEVSQLVAAMLAVSADEVIPLAELVFAKTDGNPFFAIQFVLSLAEDHLLAFDTNILAWRWELAAIEARSISENVVEVMLEKIGRLPSSSRAAIVRLAFLGDTARPTVLAAAMGVDASDVHGEIVAAVNAGMVALTIGGYLFLHDRIREAAYALIADDDARVTVHREIGERLYTANLPGTLFDVFRQLERGVGVATEETRARDAKIALAAAMEAKASAAYKAASACLVAAASRLPANAWEQEHELAFEIEILRAECEQFLGDADAATERLAALVERARTLPKRARVVRHLINAHTTRGRSDLAVAVGLSYLNAVGIDWRPHVTSEDVEREVERMHALLGGRSIEELTELISTDDELTVATLDHVIVDFTAPALYSEHRLWQLVVVGTVNFALEHGNTPGMSWMYAVAALMFTTVREDPASGRQFAHVARILADRNAPHPASARAWVTLAHHVIPWIDDCRAGDELAKRAQAAMRVGGELSFLAYVNMHMVTHLFANGVALSAVEDEGQSGRALADASRITYAIGEFDHQLALIRMLRGRTPTFGRLDDGSFREADFEAKLSTKTAIANVKARHWIRKLVARYLANDFAEAIAAADNVEPLLSSFGGEFSAHFRENADYHFFSALARARAPEPEKHRARLQMHRDQYARWAAAAPMTYGCRAAALDAELTRLDGGDAGPLFERAITRAHSRASIHNEALILEAAARYWDDCGYRVFAETYRARAREAFRQWGAEGKVREMESRMPVSRTISQRDVTSAPSEQSADQLDLATALTVSETVSSELVHEKVVEGLLSIAVKTAGAERGVLLLSRDTDLVPEAIASTHSEGIRVLLSQRWEVSPTFSEAIVRSAINSGAPLVLEDAASDGPFVSDAYISANRCRSVACVPLTQGGHLAGALYLENNLVARAFTPRRLITLKLIASQAASALENARLYSDLTKARAAEDALEATRQALEHLARVATLGELTASIAHEVMQPLTAIRVSAASATRWLAANKLPEANESLSRVTRDADSAIEVVHRLRELFKKQGTERGAMDLNDAITEVAALTRSEMTKHNIECELRLVSDAPHVLGNRVQIQQVVMNMVLNAIQAMQQVHDRPRSLRMSSERREGSLVRVVVRDNGPGIAVENPATLFQPFFSTKRGGTGVGLSICRSIVAGHDGELWYARNDGPGATFGFDLPTLESAG